MAQPPKKRDLADFFKPYARDRFLPKAVVPQKRSSPPPSQLDGADDSDHGTQSRRPTSPKPKPAQMPSTPKAPTFSLLGTPGSGTLPIRTPQSSRTQAAPPSTYTSGRLFVTNLDSAEHATTKPAPDAAPKPQSSTRDAPQSSVQTTSTQSVVRECKVIAVRDSDEDDSDSLASLNDIFGRRKEDDETSNSSPEDEEARREAERISTLRLFTNGRSDPLIGKEKMREIMAMKKSRGMNNYIARQTDHVRSTEIIKETREKYEQSLKGLDEPPSNTDLLTSFQEYLGSNEEDAEKLLGAVRRTDALTEEVSFSFFRSDERFEHDRNTAEAVDFPAHAVPRNLFRSYDDEGRSRAFLSGYMADLSSQGVLHERALDWCFMTVPIETDQALQHAYLQCLESGASHWALVNVTAPDVQSCFDKLGANPASIRLGTRLEATGQRYCPLRTSPRVESLCVVLEMFQKISPNMGFEALSMLSSMLCRLAIDQDLMGDVRIADKVGTLFNDLLGGTLGSEAAAQAASRIVADMTANLHDPTLQAHLLERISPITRLQRGLRITLAHAFLLGVAAGPAAYEAGQEAVVDLRALKTLLETSNDYATARLRTKLNYGHLRARAIILDVAISDGGRPSSFPSSEFASIKHFNRRIDALAAALRNTTTAISDTGATHMKRTEAKEKLDCVYNRLLYVVRTEPPPKKHIFDQVTGKLGDGEDVRAVGRGRDLMKSFLAKIKEEHSEGSIKADEL